MPQIIFRGLETEDLKLISRDLIAELSAVTGTDPDVFTLEVIETVMVENGRQVPNYPYVEVKWFDRGQAVQDRTAAVICTYLKRIGIAECDIYFTILRRSQYYFNEKHF